MNFKKTWKRFFSLSRRSDGFTLVELIVVIAILAILGGVAVPAYSGYITKTNKAADQSLFGEIEHAMHLAYYANSDFKGGYVTVTSTGATPSNSQIDAAMKAVFGDNWQNTVMLKHDGWNSETYKESSYYGNETQLLNKVDTLTDYLKNAIVDNQELIGVNFNNYLGNLGITNSTENADKIADAAVLYVAQDAAEMTPDQRKAVINAMSGIKNQTQDQALTSLTNAFDGNVVAASAALYAVAQSYCQYEKAQGNDRPLEILDAQKIEVTDSNQALSAVYGAFGAVAGEVMNNEKYHLDKYFEAGGQATKDAESYLDVLNTVAGAENEILNSSELGSSGFFSNDTINDMFGAIANGGAIVSARIDGEGKLSVTHPEDD